MALRVSILRPIAGSFNPKSIPSLAAWWDFNDASTVTVATGISSVTDKSGKGRSLSQTTTNNRPAWTANSINGRYAAVFDGSNDSLAASFTLSQPVTAFLVAKYNNADSGTQTMMDGTTGNTMRAYRSSSTQLSLYGGKNIVTDNTLPESWSVWEFVFNGSSSGARRNGTSILSGDAGTSSPGGVTLGTFGNGFSGPAPVSIANVLVYSAAIGSQERSSIRRWLGGLYGITTV